MVYANKGIWYSHKVGNLIIFDNMDETGECFAKWKKPDTEDKHCIISLICGILKSWTHGSRKLSGHCHGCWVGENGQILVRGYKLSIITWVGSGDPMHRMVTIVSNTVLFINLLSCAFGVVFKKVLINPRIWRFVLVLSPNSFIDVTLTCMYIIHFKLMLVHGMR